MAFPAGRSPFEKHSAVVLAALLIFGILTIWVPELWAVSLLETGVFGLAIAWAVRMIVCPYPLQGHILLIPLSGTVLWGLAQLCMNRTVYRFETWNAVLHWGTIFMVFCLALQVLADAGIRQIFRLAMLYFGFAVSVIAVIQACTSEGNVFWIFPTQYRDNVLGPFLYRNNYAAFIELLLPLALVEALHRRQRTWLFACMIATMYASVIASGSRAGAMLVTLEIVCTPALVWLCGLAPGRSVIRAVGTIGALGAAFTAVAGGSFLWQRFQQPDPYAVRRELVVSSLAMVQARPWMGFGLGTWPTAYPAYAIFDDGLFANHAHNDWVEWAAEGGVPFGLMLLYVALWTIRPAIRSVWGLGILSFYLHALVDYPFARLGLAVWPFVFSAALVAPRAQCIGPMSASLRDAVARKACVK